jgi:hypothetical protein
MEFEPPQLPRPSQGQLSDGWRTVAFITWILTAASIVAIAITSRTIGRPIWWLGPESNPASPLFILLPLITVALPLYTSTRKPTVFPRLGIICSVALLLSALLDVSSSPAVAVAVAVVSVASLSVSIALVAVARQYR